MDWQAKVPFLEEMRTGGSSGAILVTAPTPYAPPTPFTQSTPYPQPAPSSTSYRAKAKAICFFKKYFCEGQKTLDEEIHAEGGSTGFWSGEWLWKRRRLVGLLLPLCFWELLWWPLAIRHDFFRFYAARWPIALTMVFGAMVAGATSEGGGAVAFPVMTLAFHIHPAVARDFSLMIQTCGMSAAAFSILWMRIRLEYFSLAFSTLGALFGLIFGLEYLDTLISPPQKKMGFVSLFFSFAVVLFLLNRKKKRLVLDAIPDFAWWKALVLVLLGFAGGVMTGLLGSGVDIVSFSVLTLLFSVSEKVATPTSVVLMAINTSMGFYWRELMQNQVSQDAWEYLAVCVPVVVIFAPLGSIIASHFHRQVLAGLIYVLETVALVSAFAILRPGLWLSLGSIGIMVAASAFFLLLGFLAPRILPPGLKVSDSSSSATTPPSTPSTSPTNA